MNNIDEAKKALVSAIYFDDGYDFVTYTYEALQHLDPELYELCVNGSSEKAYDLVTNECKISESQSAQ